MIGRSTNLTSTILFLSAYGVKFKYTDPTYMESDLLDHLSDGCEQILLSDPGVRIIIAGDVNHLNITEFTKQHNLDQLVKKPTRSLKTLDVFLTNCPYIWKVPIVFASLVRSDHLAIMVSLQTFAKAERKHVYIRDV